MILADLCQTTMAAKIAAPTELERGAADLRLYVIETLQRWVLKDKPVQAQKVWRRLFDKAGLDRETSVLLYGQYTTAGDRARASDASENGLVAGVILAALRDTWPAVFPNEARELGPRQRDPATRKMRQRFYRYNPHVDWTPRPSRRL